MIHHVEVQVLILLLIASLVGIAAQRIRIPYTLALVLAGLALSFIKLEALSDLNLTADLLMLLFLPPLLFEAAYHLPFDDFKKNRGHILFLALAGVLIATTLTAAGTYGVFNTLSLFEQFNWGHAFLFAAVISATDPISVLALFKEMGAPKRLYQIVEGESLINDGVAVVIFAIVVAVIGLPSNHGPATPLSGLEETIVFACVTFVKTALGGILVGAGVGGLASVMTRQVDDHLIEITLTTLVAWGSFLIAEELHVSGVLSTVTAGVLMGSFGKNFGMSASTRVAVQDFWQYMGFLSNSFIFLLVGLELDPAAYLLHFPAIILAFLVVVLSRSVVVYSGIPLVDFFSKPIPGPWKHILVWGGLRGSLSMVLILGLPVDFVGRSALINLVFGVVSISLFLQGLTMSPLMKKLGMTSTAGSSNREYELARARSLSYREVIHEAQKKIDRGIPNETSYRKIVDYYSLAREKALTEITEYGETLATPKQLLDAARSLAMTEREALSHALSTEMISAATCAELLNTVDERMDELESAAQEGGEKLQEALDRLYSWKNTEPEGEQELPD